MRESSNCAAAALKRAVFFAWVVVLLFPMGTLLAQDLKVDINALTQETQRMARKSDELSLAWWIPEEFWRASFSESPEITAAQAEEFLKVLRPYFVLVIVDGTIGTMGGVTYKSEASVRENTQLVDSAGARYRPLGEDQIGPDTRNLLQMLKPVLSNMLGPLGQNMHFLLFNAKNNKGTMIAEARKEGSFTVRSGSNEYKWRLPLGSLIPQKTCPVDGEKMNGAWIYCPWHGVKLVSQSGAGGEAKSHTD